VDAARLEQFAEQQDERSFPRSAGRKISHADDSPLQALRPENSAVIKRVARCDHTAVDGRERIQFVCAACAETD